MEFTIEETDLLVQDGFVCGWMGDIQEGDIVAIPPVSRTTFGGEPRPVKTFVIQRLLPKFDGSYWDPDEDGMIHNVVVHFIGLDLDGRPSSESYGSTYPIFYKRTVV